METQDLTLLLPAGRLPLELLKAVSNLAEKHDLELYLTTLQNLRLLNVPVDECAAIKAELSLFGVSFKAPGLFPIPRVCIGKDHCKLGLIDPALLSQTILDRFSSRPHTKAKLKIAIAGCTMNCSGTRTSDIGIVATRKGFDVYAGGKGGTSPTLGLRILKDLAEDEVLDTVERLIEFHDAKTKTKQRLAKLIGEEDFPFSLRDDA